VLSPLGIAQVVLIGAGATAFMDAWLLLLKRLGVPTNNFALVGRWIGHLIQGRLTHPSIAKAQPVPYERILGWLSHYVIGMTFAGLLVAVVGSGWLEHPTLMPALVFGVATVVMPLFVMQPAMGSGFAAARTPTPFTNCLRSLANHAVFGAGLFLAATVLDWLR
jgi:hypothetical protein